MYVVPDEAQHFLSFPLLLPLPDYLATPTPEVSLPRSDKCSIDLQLTLSVHFLSNVSSEITPPLHHHYHFSVIQVPLFRAHVSGQKRDLGDYDSYSINCRLFGDSLRPDYVSVLGGQLYTDWGQC